MLRTIFPALILFAAITVRAGGDEVVVIYNSHVAESKPFAEFYAQQRGVPAQQVFGFKMTDGETMSRDEFRNDLQRPLAKKLEDLNLWRTGRGDLPSTNGGTIRVARKVVESKIRYAVLCYGVPLKIRKDSALKEKDEDTMRPELRRNEAAVDSELACLPLIYSSYTLAGPLVNPLYTTTNAMSLHPTNGLLMVVRLDGPTPAIARGLVEKALQAEADGLWGRAYFDLRNISDPGYKIGDDWIRTASQVAKFVGFDTVVDENADTFTAHFPFSQVAIYMGWYRENVSGPFVLPKVEFMPGAFAYHLHSFSAASLRTPNNNWVAPLLDKGATCTMGTVDEPFLAGTPDVGSFAARWMYFGFTFAEAAYASQSVLSWQTTVVGDPLYRPFGKAAQEIHQSLLERKSKWIEWSTIRLANMSRNQGMSALELATILEDTPMTKTSAVLTEKLAELYASQGKPASTIAALERALTRDPTPQQRIRIRLTLAEKFIAAQNNEAARKSYEKLLEENPDYTDAISIRKKITALTPKPI
jgi:uncharacterized protein (TIGR03790 family)